jgi:GAF domain-containing protein
MTGDDPRLLALSALSGLALAVAIGAALLSLVLVAAAVLATRRRPPPDYAAVVRTAVAPLEAAIADLARTLEDAKLPPAAAPAETIGDVLARAVSSARRGTAADAATIVVDAPGDGEPHVAATGLASERPPDPALLRLASPRARGVVIAYRHEDGPIGSEAIRSAVAVPLQTAGGSSGTLAAFWRTNEREPGDAELAALEAVAGRAAAEIDRALGS